MYKFLLIIIVFSSSISNGQSIYKREVDDSTCEVTVYTTIDTVGVGNTFCQSWGLIFSQEGTNYYALSYLFKAPKPIYVNSLCMMKIHFNDGELFSFSNINDADFFNTGEQIEFRTRVEEPFLKKMNNYRVTSLQFEKDSFKYTIPITQPYGETFLRLANLMLTTNMNDDNQDFMNWSELTKYKFPEN